jgi:hypothetical protein
MIAAASRTLLVPTSRTLVRNFTHQTWISGPPRIRISFAEKVGVLISVCVMASPMYIVDNIKNYRKE